MPRLREPEARVLALQIAATFPGHEATTAQIKECVPDYRELTPTDLARSPTRRNECKWQQIMGNVICHQDSGTSIFNRGLATRTQNGIRVTENGLEFLRAEGLYE